MEYTFLCVLRKQNQDQESKDTMFQLFPILLNWVQATKENFRVSVFSVAGSFQVEMRWLFILGVKLLVNPLNGREVRLDHL